jgi:DNA-binding transcriptional MerR regulator
VSKGPQAYRTISEVATELNVPQHVLRFWETRFTQIKPMKRGGGRRYYRPDDIDLLKGIRQLLYGDGFTIKGVQRILKEKGIHSVIEVGTGHAGIDVLDPQEGDIADHKRASTQSENDNIPAVKNNNDAIQAYDAFDNHSSNTPSTSPLSSINLSRENEKKLYTALTLLSECDRILQDGN